MFMRLITRFVDMEFDDATLWPSSDLLRLDDAEIDDDQIAFSINLNIHPLDHGAALVIKDSSKGFFLTS